jgi:nitrate/TMAO reductase-like tetraheme cytochrome c subunit
MRPCLRASLALVALLAIPLAASAEQAAPTPPSNDDCLVCHGDKDAKRADGSSIAVDQAAFEASKHGALACVDCHQDLASVTEFPHPEKLKPVDCSTCHDTAQAQYEAGVHGQAREGGKMLAATCVDCHGKHDIKGSDDPNSPTNHLNLPQTCAKCHGNADIIRRGHIQIGNVAARYHDSIHGRALEKAGLVVAPSCVDCHGNHDIKRKTDPSSPVARANIPATCGKCHAGILQHYDASVHGVEMKRGNLKAAVCTDCHTAHDIQRVETDAWRLGVARECGTCHVESIKTYRDTFHGQVTSLGFVRVATCADCHGSHDIQKTSDPRSRVAAANLVQTCRQCHAGANANFVKYDPHADRSDRARNPLLFYASRFMDGLLLGVFGFFGLHTALWLPRGLRARRQARAERARRRDAPKQER